MGKSSRPVASSKDLRHQGRSKTDVDIVKISENDYYSKAVEFEGWLRHHSIYFDEIDSRRARSLFEKFVRRWNSGRLNKKFYNSELMHGGKPTRWTRYLWNIDESGSNAEANKKTSNSPMNYHLKPGSSFKDGKIKHYPLSKNPELDSSYINDTAVDTITDRYEIRRRMKQKTEEMVEELLPKAVGREAKLQKKRAQATYYRHETDILPEASENMIMIGGATSNTDDFHALLSREKKRLQLAAETKDAELRSKLDAYKDKEKSTMDMLMSLANSKYGKNL